MHGAEHDVLSNGCPNPSSGLGSPPYPGSPSCHPFLKSRAEALDRAHALLSHGCPNPNFGLGSPNPSPGFALPLGSPVPLRVAQEKSKDTSGKALSHPRPSHAPEAPFLQQQAPHVPFKAAMHRERGSNRSLVNASHHASPACSGRSSSPGPLGFDEEISFRSMLSSLPRAVVACNTKFSKFLSSTFRLQRAGAPAPSSVLYPLPVPFPGVFHASGPMLAQKRFERLAFKRGVHVLAMCLNYVFCGRKWIPPAELRRPPNQQQLAAFSQIRRFLGTCGSQAPQFASCPGRRSHELTACLRNLCAFLGDSGAVSGRAPYAENAFSSVRGRAPPVDPDRPELKPYSNLCADRLKMSGSASFWPLPFLQPILIMPFLEPRVLRFKSEEPREPHPRFCTDSHDELLMLYRQWASLGLLTFTDEQVPEWQKVRVFNARKNSLVDRQIGDRRSLNLIERGVPGPSSFLPTGPLLCNILLRPRCLLVGCCTDRRDYYRQIKISPQKASCNPVGPRISIDRLAPSQVSEASRGGAKREEVGDGLGRSPLSGGKAGGDAGAVQPLFNSCFQGDHTGVEVATSAHEGVLVGAGLLQNHSRLLTRAPCPPGPAFEGLVIDDYFVLSEESSSSLNDLGCKAASVPTEASRRIGAAVDAYKRENIEGSPEKDIVNALDFCVTGAHVDSSARWYRNGMILVGVPAPKRCALMAVSVAAARLRGTSRDLLEKLVGGWAHCTMYRRPTAVCLAKIYHLIHDPAVQAGSGDEVHALPRSAAEELLLCSLLAPMMATNLKACLTASMLQMLL